MDWKDGDVIFRASSPGDEQIVDGYVSAGTLDAWIEAIEPLQHYPRVLTALYASFAAPLLYVLDCPNFVVDLCSRTSQGKTTTQRLAASVWGVPDERKPAAAITTWDTTLVGFERLAAVVCDLPLIADDTKRAKKPEEIAKVLYMVTSGRGKTRGAVRGLATTAVWRTVLITSGEQPVTSFTNDGGTRMRVLQIEGPPFGKQDIETGKIVEKLSLALRSNYGVAGREFIRRLIGDKDKWPEFKAEFQRRTEAYIETATSERAGRLATYAACVAQAATLAHTYLDFPFPFDDPIAKMWDEISGEADDALGAKRALRYLVSWASQNEHRFDGRQQLDRDGCPIIPASGIVGKWDQGEGYESIAFLPHIAEELLTAQKFHPEAIFNEWLDNEWLEVTSEDGRRRHTKLVRIREERAAKARQVRMIVIKREAIEKVEA
jgi:hypothetical protein